MLVQYADDPNGRMLEAVENDVSIDVDQAVSSANVVASFSEFGIANEPVDTVEQLIVVGIGLLFAPLFKAE